MNQVRLVLVRPRFGENIGFVARLCANFGIPELILLDPPPGWRQGAERTAAMCPEVLDRARLAGSLEEACADRAQVLGLTARSGREREVLPLRDLPARLPGARTALLFGNEEGGLTSRELGGCTALFTISLPGLSSLNLSHAVAITLHACVPEGEASPGADPSHALLDSRGRLLLARRIEEVLTELAFPVRDPHFQGTLSRLLGRSIMQTRDARILHKVLRHLRWLRQNRGL